jgi:hypothetical protein
MNDENRMSEGLMNCQTAHRVPAPPNRQLKFADVWGVIFIGIYVVDFQVIKHG